MTDRRKPEEIAVSRHKIITPLLIAQEERADAAKIVQIRKDICLQNGISRRTLRRWLDAHRTDGFEGLKPLPRLHGRAARRFFRATSPEVISTASRYRRN